MPVISEFRRELKLKGFKAYGIESQSKVVRTIVEQQADYAFKDDLIRNF